MRFVVTNLPGNALPAGSVRRPGPHRRVIARLTGSSTASDGALFDAPVRRYGAMGYGQSASVPETGPSMDGGKVAADCKWIDVARRTRANIAGWWLARYIGCRRPAIPS